VNGRGYLFPGKSGAGKSTISGLLASRGHEVLSDDRVIVRKIEGHFRFFGTPWPGEANIAVNKNLPLSGIFFLNHSEGDRVKKIDPQEALERLMPVTSIPWYDSEPMTKVLTFCSDLVSAVPAYVLHFKPGQGAADFFEAFVSR
jgi:hypothetical protein